MPTLSRVLVARALRGVFEDSQRISNDWDANIQGSDASLAQAMLGLCLRHWGRMQAWLKIRLKDPKRELPIGTQIALATGIAQLAWLPGVSTHAAVNESVDLASDSKQGFPPHKGLCNAILRSAAKNRSALQSELEALPASLDRSPFTENALHCALSPRGQEGMLEDLWKRLQEPPRPCFRALNEDSLPLGLESDPQLKNALRLAEEAAFPRPWLIYGSGMVQDLSSQALMEFEAHASPKRILDACAAPGGKTTLLSRRWPSADLIALEANPRRIKLLESNLAMRHVKAKIEVQDAVKFLKHEPECFDLILIDAPCSGSGTLRKHPELTWLGHDVDFARLVNTQRAMIQAAIPRLSQGGMLVYAVCSWVQAEGVEHLKWLLSGHNNLKRIEPWPKNQMIGGIFHPDPLNWNGEGFQAWACVKV